MGDGRDENGRFAPGHRLGGARRYTTDVKQAFEQLLPADQLVERWLEAWEAAKKHDAAKAMVTLLEFALGYTIGKPKQSLEVGTSDNSQLLAALLADRRPLLPPREGIVEDDTLLIEAHTPADDDGSLDD